MKRIILSGGGTGGHIYPAVAVAEALGRHYGANAELLFVGAEGKMEMEKVPALGYRIVGLPIAGMQRRLELRNLAVPFKAVLSVLRARRIIRDFGADVVVGFGGYASGPVLWTAQRMGVPTIIQEQNSYAGVTNKILARGAAASAWPMRGWNGFSRPTGSCTRATRCGAVFASRGPTAAKHCTISDLRRRNRWCWWSAARSARARSTR